MVPCLIATLTVLSALGILTVLSNESVFTTQPSGNAGVWAVSSVLPLTGTSGIALPSGSTA